MVKMFYGNSFIRQLFLFNIFSLPVFTSKKDDNSKITYRNIREFLMIEHRNLVIGDFNLCIYLI